MYFYCFKYFKIQNIDGIYIWLENVLEDLFIGYKNSSFCKLYPCSNKTMSDFASILLGSMIIRQNRVIKGLLNLEFIDLHYLYFID